MIILSGAGTVGAPSITDPSELADIWEWWEPSRESFADNDPIGTLTGQFAPGTGHNWTQTGGARPTYKDAILNGHGIARFDGSDDEMVSVNPTALTAVHFFAVIRMDSNTPALGKSGTWSFGISSNAYPITDTPTQISCDSFRNAAHSFSKSGIDVAQWRVVEIVSVQSSGKWIYRLDGTELVNQTTTFAHQSSGFIRVGRDGPFGSNWLDGDVAGMYICSAELSSGDRTAMINHLNSRFGLSAS